MAQWVSICEDVYNMGPNAGAATRWVLSKIPQDSGKPEATPFSRTTKHYSAFSPLPLHTHRCGLAPAGFEPRSSEANGLLLFH